jgi:hypothetical protein
MKKLRRDSLPDLFVSDSYEANIQGVHYKRDISVGLAFFNKSTPFHLSGISILK